MNNNLGWAIPIALFLITQTAAAIWWGSNINANVSNYSDRFDRYESVVKEGFEEVRRTEKEDVARLEKRIEEKFDEVSNEQQQQWDAIDDSENNINDVLREIAVLNQSITTIAEDLKETTGILRDRFDNKTKK